jgi:opacity protein-like surface antigen
MLSLVAAFPLFGKDLPDNLTGHIGAGFALPVGSLTRHHTGTGGAFTASAGPRFSRFSLLADLSYNDMEVDSLEPDGVDTNMDANMRLWSLTVNPTFDYIRLESFNSYVTAGYGLYSKGLLLRRADSAPFTVCDEFWSICSSGVTSDTLLGWHTTYKGGLNVGAGFAYGGRAKFFVEARYHRMFTTNKDTAIVPITFGVRW